jgi:hypothetical protein
MTLPDVAAVNIRGAILSGGSVTVAARMVLADYFVASGNVKVR